MSYDAIIIGGGPAGSTAALCLARKGYRVIVIDKVTHPRFHVGESFLPRGFTLLQELGLEPRLRKLAHMVKLGAEFGMGGAADDETTKFAFSDGIEGGRNETFNIERAPFDGMLLDAAREAGAEVRQDLTVKKIVRLADGDVEIVAGDETVRGKYLLDASGQGTVLGRHLGTRKGFDHHRKVAYFGHFENVQRLSGDEEGYPTVVICEEGWFWMIPIDPRRVSIGFVMDADVSKRVNLPAAQMLAWAVARCPLVRRRTANAKFPAQAHTVADFSYDCAPYAGPGYFLVGDAAFFLDPIFSTGACLAMMGGAKCAEGVDGLIRGTVRHDKFRREYSRFIKGSSNAFFELVNLFYVHSFRELFLHGVGPANIRGAVISLLAGHVFPRPSWSIRWRMAFFRWVIKAQKHFELAPRREPFSLQAQKPDAVSDVKAA